jgi:hypothetical protein
MDPLAGYSLGDIIPCNYDPGFYPAIFAEDDQNLRRFILHGNGGIGRIWRWRLEIVEGAGREVVCQAAGVDP